MNAFDDINQKIIIVVVFTAVFLLLWLFVKNRFSEKIQISNQTRFSHIESRRLAHSNIVSLFEIDQKKILILQSKHGSTALDITNNFPDGDVDDAVL
ncbi:MAG: hypothetical protein ACPHL3_07615 [Paracoccaceae bacterium]